MTDEKAPQNHFSIQKIYIKDASFESPATPTVFGFKQWDPKIELNLTNRNSTVGKDVYEAVLMITATVNHEDKTAFLIEVHQAGVFSISGFNDKERDYLLGSQCMSILLPYAREAISDMSVKGGFPPLILSPVNFDALYQQHLQEKQKAAESNEAEQAETVKH